MYSASQREIGEYSSRMRLEVGVEFFGGYPEGQRACSRRVYRVSASDRDLLIKNMGFCCPCSFSLNKAALAETSETTM